MTESRSTTAATSALWLATEELDTLIQMLRADGFDVVGPRIQDGAIVYKTLESSDQLPVGWTDQQEAGSYRLKQTDGATRFEFNVGPQSWKQFLFPPRLTVSTADRTESGWSFDTPPPDTTRYALLGVRACELAAIAIQDRVFKDGPYQDREYVDRRSSAMIIAVNCTVAAENCFCTSMGTGPRCEAGFDLALTELDDGYVLEVGSDLGARFAAQLSTESASDGQLAAAEQLRGRAVQQISKRLDTDGLPERLVSHLDHPHWDEVANRCLSCTNCTMVCPTCFCSTVEEVADLQGDHVERQRQWDSCFHLDFGYTAAGTARNSIRNRYRQWLTHKLSTWHDQFDSSGCVGCGRCITWCPVGIDLTEEVPKLIESPKQRRTMPSSAPPPDVCRVPDSDQEGTLSGDPSPSPEGTREG